MDYQDFVVLLDRAPDGRAFLTQVVRSPAGEAKAPFVNPIAPAELDRLWQAAFLVREESQAGGARDLAPQVSQAMNPAMAEISLEELGSRLFKALFTGPVYSCWVRSMAAAQSTNRGLRLRLQIDLSDPFLAPLAELPWEYLFSLEHSGFLGLQRKTPIVRHIQLSADAGRPFETRRPLRVLIVAAQSNSMPQLSLEKEQKRIAETLGKLPGVETLPLYNLGVEALRDELLQRDFHVLHFMGHGGFHSRSGEGVLYFTGSHGAPVPVPGPLLAYHLSGIDSLRLVFLNACDTARTHSDAPFAGVATALLLAGLPAVIAMQRPIRDGSALELSRTVYRRLALGDPIEAAVTEGRLAIAREHGALLGWGTPVLFSRVEDGRLFSPEPAPVLPEQPIPRPPRSAPLRVAAAVVAVGFGFGFAVQWPFDREQKPAADPAVEEKTVSEAREPEPASPPPQKQALEIQGASVLQPRIERERSEPEKPKRTAVKTPAWYEVSEETPAAIPELDAEVSVRFFDREGIARFWVAPRGMEMLEQPPVMGPQSIDYPTPRGTYRLDVQSLDFEARSAKVSLSLVR